MSPAQIGLELQRVDDLLRRRDGHVSVSHLWRDDPVVSAQVHQAEKVKESVIVRIEVAVLIRFQAPHSMVASGARSVNRGSPRMTIGWEAGFMLAPVAAATQALRKTPEPVCRPHRSEFRPIRLPGCRESATPSL